MSEAKDRHAAEAEGSEGLSSANQSAINAYDRMLQEKERIIREGIAAKYEKIHAVERQLETLRVALHVNVGPRRQALEHLRYKIEQQNHKIDVHRTEYRKHKQLAEEARAAMEREEALKNEMAAELNTLVQQSANAQLKKLEELSAELEHLTGGMPSEAHVAATPATGPTNGAATAAAAAAHGGGSASAGDAAVVVQAAGQRQQQQAKAAGGQFPAVAGAGGFSREQQQAPAGGTAEQQQRQQQREEAELRRQKLQQQQQRRQAAADAKGRHVQLGGGKAARPGQAPGTTTRIPQPASLSGGASSPAGRAASSSVASPGPFRGFD